MFCTEVGVALFFKAGGIAANCALSNEDELLLTGKLLQLTVEAEVKMLLLLVSRFDACTRFTLDFWRFEVDFGVDVEKYGWKLVCAPFRFSAPGTISLSN